MSISRQFKLQPDEIDRYAQFLVPTIFGPFARALVRAANLHAGETVLDVGCGTGAATRFAAQQVGSDGRVIGVDIDPDMIRTARATPFRQGAVIEWYETSAYCLPLSDDTVDTALCAHTLQFLDAHSSALSEMYRVLKPAGRVAISVWSALEDNPFSNHLIQVIRHDLGPEMAAEQSAAFELAQHGEIKALLTDAGFDRSDITVTQLTLRLPGVEQLVPRYISATPLAGAFHAASRTVQSAIIHEMSERLAGYQSEGGLLIPFSSTLIFGCKNN